MQHAASHSRLRCGLRVAGVSALMTLNHQLPRDRQRVLTLPPFDGAFFFESRLNRAAHVIIEL